MADVQMPSADALRAEQAVIDAGTEAMDYVTHNLRPTNEVIGTIVAAFLKFAATTAVRFDMPQDVFLKIARHCYENIRTLTREVDAEDDN
jgi:hypothetical protein